VNLGKGFKQRLDLPEGLNSAEKLPEAVLELLAAHLSTQPGGLYVARKLRQALHQRVPYKVAASRTATVLTVQACGGAKSADIQNTQLGALGPSTKFVTVTAGGNDVGFKDVIVACFFGDCKPALETARSKISNELSSKLNALYHEIAIKAPAAQIVVLGYPELVPPTGCGPLARITVEEAQIFHQVALLMRTVIARQAVAHGLTFQDAIPAFEGHEACTTTPWINGYVSTPFYSPEYISSFHPNVTGNLSGYAPLVRAVTG
jgi:lysophospholipase L1-like esterase